MFFFLWIFHFAVFSNEAVPPTGAVCDLVDSSYDVKGGADGHLHRIINLLRLSLFSALKITAAFNCRGFCGCVSAVIPTILRLFVVLERDDERVTPPDMAYSMYECAWIKCKLNVKYVEVDVSINLTLY